MAGEPSNKVYMEQGGDKLVIASGGELDAESCAAASFKMPDDAVTSGKIAALAVTAGKLASGAVSTAAKIADAILDGAKAATVADDNVVGGLPLLHRIDIADGAGDTDVTLTHKTRVLDVWAVKTAANGGAGDTVTVKNGATAITDALDLNVNDKVVVRAGEIDDAQHEIAAAGTLRVTAANNTNNACTVYVLGIRVA